MELRRRGEPGRDQEALAVGRPRARAGRPHVLVLVEPLEDLPADVRNPFRLDGGGLLGLILNENEEEIRFVEDTGSYPLPDLGGINLQGFEE